MNNVLTFCKKHGLLHEIFTKYKSFFFLLLWHIFLSLGDRLVFLLMVSMLSLFNGITTCPDLEVWSVVAYFLQPPFLLIIVGPYCLTKTQLL